MLFRGLRAFRTSDPGQLADDLRRENAAVEDGFAETERQLAQRSTVVRVVEDFYTAKHGELIAAGYNQNAKILLPLSTPETAGRSVHVIRVNATFAVTLVAQSDQLVNDATTADIGATVGFREYIDDGAGGWWGPAI